MGTGIVVLDAEPLVCSVIGDILTRAGYEVHETGEFGDALKVLHSLRPDLLLTNVFLRDIRGLEAVSIVKTRFPGVRVLMLSGLPDADVIAEWINTAGFEAFPKPFTGRALIEKSARFSTTELLMRIRLSNIARTFPLHASQDISAVYRAQAWHTSSPHAGSNLRSRFPGQAPLENGT